MLFPTFSIYGKSYASNVNSNANFLRDSLKCHQAELISFSSTFWLFLHILTSCYCHFSQHFISFCAIVAGASQMSYSPLPHPLPTCYMNTLGRVAIPSQLSHSLPGNAVALQPFPCDSLESCWKTKNKYKLCLFPCYYNPNFPSGNVEFWLMKGPLESEEEEESYKD